MGYLLAVLLALFTPNAYEAWGVNCHEIARQLDESVEWGNLTPEERDEIVERCIKNFGE